MLNSCQVLGFFCRLAVVWLAGYIIKKFRFEPATKNKVPVTNDYPKQCTTEAPTPGPVQE